MCNHRWTYVGRYRYCYDCKSLEYHSSYEIDGFFGERWIRVDDVPEAVDEFWDLLESEGDDVSIVD